MGEANAVNRPKSSGQGDTEKPKQPMAYRILSCWDTYEMAEMMSTLASEGYRLHTFNLWEGGRLYAVMEWDQVMEDLKALRQMGTQLQEMGAKLYESGVSESLAIAKRLAELEAE